MYAIPRIMSKARLVAVRNFALAILPPTWISGRITTFVSISLFAADSTCGPFIMTACQAQACSRQVP